MGSEAPGFRPPVKPTARGVKIEPGLCIPAPVEIPGAEEKNGVEVFHRAILGLDRR